MNRLLNNWKHSHIELGEHEAETLSNTVSPLKNTIQIKTVEHTPSTLQQFTENILEYQSQWLGLKNTSPTAAYEITRTNPEQVRIQFAVPTDRLERKIRTQLPQQIPGIKFTEGTTGLPVTPGDTVGGGLLTTGLLDHYPLKKEFDKPPINSIIASLHRHALRDTQVVIQVLFQPVIGKPLRRYYWRRRAYQRINYLRKEKEKIWGSRSATPREKHQADQIERKAGSPRFHVSIRILLINSGEYTPSRLKELSGPFNSFENVDSGQYLNTTTITPFRRSELLDFAETVASRQYRGWSQSFQASTEELAALITVPSSNHRNIENAEP